MRVGLASATLLRQGRPVSLSVSICLPPGLLLSWGQGRCLTEHWHRGEDRLGLETIYLQAKRWAGSVGRPDIHKFVGALHGRRARKGVFMTTSTFTREAIDDAGQIDTKIVLVDGRTLARLMILHDVGCSPAQTYVVKKLDSDSFVAE